MEDSRREQIEALEVLAEFNQRLVKNIKIVIKELSGNRLDDTEAFLKSILDAVNWEIEVVNGTLALLNEDAERIDKEAFNAGIVALGDAVAAKDDARMAAAFEELLPIFENLGTVAQEICEGANN